MIKISERESVQADSRRGLGKNTRLATSNRRVDLGRLVRFNLVWSIRQLSGQGVGFYRGFIYRAGSMLAITCDRVYFTRSPLSNKSH